MGKERRYQFSESYEISLGPRYTMHRKTPTKKFPSVITVFSAPNYIDVYKNRGAVIKYKDKNITIR